MENNEQWLVDGNCNICRRRTYCKKPCKKNSQLLDRIMRESFAHTTAGKIAKVVADKGGY